MTMTRAPYRTNVSRRQDGLVQIRVLPAPAFSLGTLRSLGIGAVGATLLVAALVLAPFWAAWNARHTTQGRSAARGANVTDLGGHRR